MAKTQRFAVDGETFDVAPHASLPDRYQFTWASGQHAGYGFTAA